MPSAPADIEAAEELVADRPDPKDVLRRSLIKGVAIVFPLVITLFVVSFVVGFVWAQISPLVDAVVSETFLESEFLVTLSTFAVVVALVFVIGAYAEYGSNRGVNRQFDEFMASIPGLGSVYTSFNEMSELLLDSDTDSFQDVKLVEYPGEDSYVVAFKTAETPAAITRDTGNEDMMTLFMPMAPNPVMGGFVIHVSSERVVDVDLTIEQGIRSIVTSGVAIGEDDDFVPGLDEEQLRRLGLSQDGTARFATGTAGRSTVVGRDTPEGQAPGFGEDDEDDHGNKGDKGDDRDEGDGDENREDEDQGPTDGHGSRTDDGDCT